MGEPINFKVIFTRATLIDDSIINVRTCKIWGLAENTSSQQGLNATLHENGFHKGVEDDLIECLRLSELRILKTGKFKNFFMLKFFGALTGSSR